MKTYRSSILIILFFTIFLTATGLGTVTFLMPVYAESLGANYIDLGVIGAVGSVVYTLITLLCGYILDRFERVRLYLIFTIFGSFVTFLFVFTQNVMDLIIMRGLNGFVSATFWVSASTLTADISPVQDLTRSMGRYNLAWITGFTVGPYLGGILSSKFGFNTFFISLGICILLSSIIVLLKIYPKIKLSPVARMCAPSFRSLEGLIVAYLTLLPFSMILGIYMAIIPGHMSTIGLAASTIGLLITLTNGIRGINFMIVERYVKSGTRNSLFLASILLIASMFLMQYAQTMIGFLVPLTLYGFSAGIITPVVLDFITKRTPKETLGSAMGVHEGVYGLGMTFGPIIGGAIAEIYGPNNLYLMLAFLAVTIIPLTIKLTSRKTVSNL